MEPPVADLARRLQTLAAHAPERGFARFEGARGDETISLLQLAGQAHAVAARLLAQGLRAGERVLVMTANSPAALSLIHGLLRAGLVWVPVNPALVGEALAHVIRTTEPGLIVCDPQLQDRLAQLPAAASVPIQTIQTLATCAAQQASAAASDLAFPAPDDLAAIMFTSGTTGPAKGVQVTQRMLALAAHAVALCAEVQPGDRLFVWEPFYHIGGAQVIMLPLVREVSLEVAERFSASRFWQQVAHTRCTHIHHLGGMIQLLLKQPASAWERAHQVRIAWGGGCAPEVWHRFEARFGVQIRECYGMTECSSLTTWNSEGAVGSVGRPAPWFEVDIQNPEDPQGRALGAGERGEIVVRSRIAGAITAGYYRNPQASAQAIRADGFHTGDLGSWDAAGRLRFHGRLSDSVRCKGENVSAFEVESVALRHPQVREVALVGVPGELGEQDIQLFIQPQPGTPPEPAELWAWLAPQLAPYQRPRYIALVDDFPRTASQRIQKHQLVIDASTRWQADSRR